jgi:hypothetical protein
MASAMMPSNIRTDSPHGKDFKINCDVCHTSKSWKLDRTIYSFNHNKTALPLTGQHELVDCRSCHATLVFSDAKTGCVDCHTDLHEQTVGPDCARCHTPKSWIVENITGLHQQSRFPLLGPHFTADCSRCHKSASLLRFDPLGVECFDCHQSDYYSTTSPNHVQNGYSTNCIECHAVNSTSWTEGSFTHSFFPLVQGHSHIECITCHTNGTFTKIPADCYSCHQADYNGATNPNHVTSNFPTQCNYCHDLTPGWKPANFKNHDQLFFPIYSGSHQGTWTSCTDCHANPPSYTSFTCIDCHAHNQTDMNNRHNEVGDYSYNSAACYSCHPNGTGGDKMMRHRLLRNKN